jgi:uncharacterized membrane protein YgcG
MANSLPKYGLSLLLASILAVPIAAAEDWSNVIKGGVSRTHTTPTDAATNEELAQASDSIDGVVYCNSGESRRVHKTTDFVVGLVREPSNVDSGQVFGAVMFGLQMTNSIMNASGGYGGGGYSSGGGHSSGGGYSSGGRSCGGH